MSKFEKGDLVVCVNSSIYVNVFKGSVYTVEYMTNDGQGMKLQGLSYSDYKVEDFKLYEDTSKYHKHHDLIVAWAKGAVIQYKVGIVWEDISRPAWLSGVEYRIKPEKAKAGIEKEAILEEMGKLKKRLEELEVSDG